jgi:hypothetical protein
MKVGVMTSALQLTVREAVAVFPQASVAVNVLVCEPTHPVVEAAPSLEVMVVVPHPSVALAVPNAAIIAGEVGLHPRITVV